MIKMLKMIKDILAGFWSGYWEGFKEYALAIVLMGLLCTLFDAFLRWIQLK